MIYEKNEFSEWWVVWLQPRGGIWCNLKNRFRVPWGNVGSSWTCLNLNFQAEFWNTEQVSVAVLQAGPGSSGCAAMTDYPGARGVSQIHKSTHLTAKGGVWTLLEGRKGHTIVSPTCFDMECDSVLHTHFYPILTPPPPHSPPSDLPQVRRLSCGPPPLKSSSSGYGTALQTRSSCCATSPRSGQIGPSSW